MATNLELDRMTNDAALASSAARNGSGPDGRPVTEALRQAHDRIASLENQVGHLQAELSLAAAFTDMRLRDVECTLVKGAMQRFNGNISRASRALGLSRSALYRRLERHKLAMS